MRMRSSSKRDGTDRIEGAECTPATLAERRRAFEAAQRHWPTVTIRFELFCAQLSHLGHTDALPTYPSSLYLCIACGLGVDAACKLLESKYFPALRACVAKFDHRADVVEDILQQVRARLLVGPAARIRTYSGRGSLDGWLRTVARNAARDFLRAQGAGQRQSWQRPDTGLAGAEYLHSAPPSSPEDEAFGDTFAPIIQRAITQSVRTLGSEERQLLYHYFVSDLCIDDLGRMYSVNRSTAARRILRNVRRIQRELRKELLPRLGQLEPGELESWVPLLFARLEMNVDVLLGPSGGPP